MNGKFRTQRNVSGTFTILTSDDVLAIDVSAAVSSATFPLNPTDGLTFTLIDKKGASATHNITVNPAAQPTSQTVNFAATDTISTNSAARTYSYSLADNNWAIIGN